MACEEGVGASAACPSGPAAAAGAGVFGAAGGFGGAGFSGLIPPSHDGPEYMSAERPLAFHFSSKSAAALFGVWPVPTTSFHGYTFGPIWQLASERFKYNAMGLPR